MSIGGMELVHIVQREASRRFAALPQEEKKRIKDQELSQMKQYKADMKEYLAELEAAEMLQSPVLVAKRQERACRKTKSCIQDVYMELGLPREPTLNNTLKQLCGGDTMPEAEKIRAAMDLEKKQEVNDAVKRMCEDYQKKKNELLQELKKVGTFEVSY